MTETVIENRLLLLNSRDARIFNNGTYKSDVVFYLRGLLKQEKNLVNFKYQFINATIPVSFFNINETNNVLIYEEVLVEYTITIPPGNYNYNTLRTMMISVFALQGIVMEISINRLTGILTFTHTAGEFMFVGNGSTMLRTLGFLPNENIPSDPITFELIAAHPLNLLSPLKLKIKSTAITSSNLDTSTNGYSNLISTFPVDQPSFGLIIHENKNIVKYIVRNDLVDDVDIQITDENDNLINFNNIDWCITLMLETTKEIIPVSKDDFDTIVKNNQPQAQLVQQPDPLAVIDTNDNDLMNFIYLNGSDVLNK
jgi:hypothetical protein